MGSFPSDLQGIVASYFLNLKENERHITELMTFVYHHNDQRKWRDGLGVVLGNYDPNIHQELFHW